MIKPNKKNIILKNDSPDQNIFATSSYDILASAEKRSHSCCFTGHRFIAKSHINKIESNLSALISDLASNGITDFICGGALGFDTIAAKSIIKEKSRFPNINLILALPCRDHFKNWHKNNIEVFKEITENADEIIYISDEYYDGCMQKRNRYMVENSLHCVFYMTNPVGGTAYTVRYALQSELIIHNIMTI